MEDATRRVLMAAIRQLVEMKARPSGGWTQTNQWHLDRLVEKLNSEEKE